MNFSLFLALLTLTAPLAAALPPLAQELKELKALLESPELTQILPMSTQIGEIRKTEEGYQLKTSEGLITVRVLYLPSSLIGPAKFRFEFTRP